MHLDEIEGSPTLELVNLVLQKQAKGEKILSLAIGEPSFDTPKEIIEAAYNSMLSGKTHYTSSYGIPEVREAIRKKVWKRNGIKAELDNTIFVSTKLGVYVSLQAVSQQPYEALIPDPGYFYSEPVVLSGGKPVYYRLSENFSLDMEEVKRKTGDRTKVIIINTPANPTGKVLGKDELRELYDFCSTKGIYILSDEAYEDLVYEKNHFSIGSLERQPEYVISLFSLSKSYAMTGWRAGYVVGSERVVYLINKFLENTLTCFPPFIQYASAYALDHGDSYIEKFRQEFFKRRQLLMDSVKQIGGLKLPEIEGAFYAFPRYRAKMGSVEFAKRLLDKHGVAVLPGSSFGPSGEGHIRISFSGSEESIEQGINKLSLFLSDIA
jgi:aspartate aminotransferase